MKTVRQVKKTKTRLCSWCWKRKPSSHVICVGKFLILGHPLKARYICNDCNLKHDVV